MLAQQARIEYSLMSVRLAGIVLFTKFKTLPYTSRRRLFTIEATRIT
ncbi:hypothetical protein WG66_015637 [Moniliophthora roreri]|nr:hypothetical protein WG66_015637 [Moniliophthora roreri]